MQQPTIEFEGVEIPDFGDRPYPYGVVELTKHCNLRCTTCFFFQAFQHDAKDLRDAELIEKLRALQKRHRIKFISLVGGEPLLRPKVVEAACEIFPAGVLFTNGTLPLPDLPISIGVSLDGPPEINDQIRGAGGWDRVVKNIANAPRPVFIQSVVNQRNLDLLETFTQQLIGLPNVVGVIYSIYVPQQGDASGLGFTLPERDHVIDLLLRIKDRHGDFLLNERRAIELAYSSACKRVTDACDMKQRSLALDYRLRRRRPCCYGENVNCDLCAAPTPFSQAARREGKTAGSAEALTEAIRESPNRNWRP